MCMCTIFEFGVVAQALNSSTWEAEKGSSAFKASLVYRSEFRTARAL